MGDPSAEAQLAAVKSRLVAPAVPTVRVSNKFGQCSLVGPLTSEVCRPETTKRWNGDEIVTDRGWYVANGRRVMKNPKIKGSMRGDRRAHLQPCLSCSDHPNYAAHWATHCSIHGSQEPCETCMST